MEDRGWRSEEKGRRGGEVEFKGKIDKGKEGGCRLEIRGKRIEVRGKRIEVRGKGKAWGRIQRKD